MLRSRTIQAAFVGAVVSALGSIGAAIVGASMQAGDASASVSDPPAITRSFDASVYRSCVALEGEVLHFAARYPDAARHYAQPGKAAGLPALATREQIASCGNPERLLEAVYR
ncbi:MAG: hypothetical protein ACJ76L_03325 [Conexibacter sp.]